MEKKRKRFGAKFIEMIFGKKQEEKFFSKELKSPVSGKVIRLEDVEDETFRNGTMGQGCAIDPEEGFIWAPCDGVVSVLPEECYAIGITSMEGIDILVHVGFDTVRLKGKHFTPLVKEGETVKTGQILIKFDRDAILKDGYSLTTTIVVSNTEDFASATTVQRPGDQVQTTDTLLVVEN